MARVASVALLVEEVMKVLLHAGLYLKMAMCKPYPQTECFSTSPAVDLFEI